MNRCETAHHYHGLGYNCAQAVVWAFGDVLPIPADQAVNVYAGYGGGVGSGELCGAVAGAIGVLGMMHPVDPSDPAGGKKLVTGMGKGLQAKFVELFRHIRCHDLLRDPTQPSEATPAALAMGITKHCDLMVVSAVELLEAMLKEEGKID